MPVTLNRGFLQTFQKIMANYLERKGEEFEVNDRVNHTRSDTNLYSVTEKRCKVIPIT